MTSMTDVLTAVEGDGEAQLIAAQELIDKGQYPEAVVAAQEAINALEAAGDTLGQAKATVVFLQAKSQEENGWDEVIKILPGSLPLIEDMEDDELLSQMYLLQAQAPLAQFEKGKGRIPEGQLDAIASTVHNDSMTAARSALDVCRRVKGGEQWGEVGQANALYLMTQSYNVNKQYTDAIRFGTQAQMIFKGLKDYRMQAAVCLTMAEACRSNGNTMDTWRHAKEAMSTAQKSGDRLIMEGAMNFNAQLELSTRATFTGEDGKEAYKPYVETDHSIARCCRYETRARNPNARYR